MMKTISILGCGWLGLPLAESLIKDGYSVKGSTTTDLKLPVLQSKSIDAYKIVLNPDLIGENAEKFFDCEVLVLNIPTLRRNDIIEYHFLQIESVVNHLRNSACKKIIFISSTSVYGNKNTEVDENSKTLPDTLSGEALVIVENYLRQNKNFDSTIIRFGGLIGPGRNPAKFALSRDVIEYSDTPLNLIHLDDCIGIIKCVLEKDVWNEIINGVCEYHPTRKEFYSLSAEKLSLPEPEFREGKEPYKIVKSKKINSLLNYQFKFPNPLDSL
ncbi:NAD-dependent epimerase/dehydratase family protein [Ignavibacterium sp.]|uniref:NAD-dependent epimerase/dehydratase family protein n=1 Tax=Ignavibacterium sp. TaxID=2651167 RepID=UPI0025C5059E|nr:NAD-dependent epimerase/dehydratase family protein [Ignavibacterium sp.]